MISKTQDEIFSTFKYRIFRWWDKIEQLKKGEIPTPVMGILHPDYGCNHNCPGCDFRAENNKTPRVWSADEEKRVLDNLIEIGIKGVEFAGGGEPLLDKNIPTSIRRLSKEGISTGVLTNGSFLQDDVRDAILNHSSYVRVSLESGSPEVFREAKGLKSDKEFYKVVENVRETIENRTRKTQIGSKLPQVSLKFTVGCHNYLDLEKGVLLGTHLGADSIQFKYYENVDGVETAQGKKIQLKETKIVSEKLEELKQQYKNQISIVGDLKKTSIEGKCWLSPLITLIDAYGDVFLCSYYRHRPDSHKIGNLFTQNTSLKNIWGGEKHRQAISKVKPEECNKYDCRFHKYHKLVESTPEGFFDAL